MKNPDQNKAVKEIIRQQLESNLSLKFKVTSRSMEPLIRVDDQVVVTRLNPAELVSGEIIMFEKGSIFCCHRFITREIFCGITYYVTKGDRLFGFDLPFPTDKILGKVESIERKQRVIDLTNQDTQLLSRILGFVFRVHWKIYKSGKVIKNITFKKKYQPITHFVLKLLFFPFSIISKLASQYAASRNSTIRAE